VSPLAKILTRGVFPELILNSCKNVFSFIKMKKETPLCPLLRILKAFPHLQASITKPDAGFWAELPSQNIHWIIKH